ncbi:MAG: restriction endonuclease subunit S, partial [Taibaiella sp.]|nr:restriction endonuclease subunit S [Taibaiella sp.]
MSDWKEYKIGMLGEIVTGKTPSSQFPEEFGNDIPFVTPTDYKNYNKWIVSADRGLSEKGLEKLSNKQLPPKSILVTCIGSDMGKVAINKFPVITNQQINSIIPNSSICPNFLFYKLVSIYDTLRMYGQSGTAVPIVNKGDFEGIELEIPEDIGEQKEIGEVLSSLDDKIDLLHCQNKTLEQLAETLFRQWFVEEVDDSLADEKLGDYVVFDPKEKIDRSEPVRFFDMKCLSNNDMSIADGTVRTISSASSFRNNDTLLAKITPCLENGKTGFVMNLDDKEIARG